MPDLIYLHFYSSWDSSCITGDFGPSLKIWLGLGSSLQGSGLMYCIFTQLINTPWAWTWVLHNGLKEITGDTRGLWIWFPRPNLQSHSCAVSCFISTDARYDQTPGREERRLVRTGPPPGCSALALVSTWLCPLSASQKAAEWGSIETNSLCRTQLMGLPGLGRKGGAAGLWLLILPHKHARNLPPGICPVTITNPPPSKPTSFPGHTWIHPKISPSHSPTYKVGWVKGEWLLVVHSLVNHNGPETEKKREVV